MPRIVSEIMNRELFSFEPRDLVEDALADLDALGITAAPVVDDENHPIGAFALRDGIRRAPGLTVADRMSPAPMTLRETAPIDEAARLLGETMSHHVIIVDAHGRAVGMLSALDVLRGLLGLPARHPGAFPHYDRATGLVWTDDFPLSADHIEAAPDGPGVLLLLHGGAGIPERPVWTESTTDLRARLLAIVTSPQPRPLANLVERGGLRFRAASVVDDAERLEIMRGAIRDVYPSAALGTVA